MWKKYLIECGWGLLYAVLFLSTLAMNSYLQDGVKEFRYVGF